MPDPSTLLDDLDRLARNLRWAWDAPTRALFEQLDPSGWRTSGRDPVAVLAGLDARRLEAAAAQPRYVAQVRAAVEDLDAYLADTDTWFRRSGGDPDRTVAYLSAEFAVADCLRIFSGGLGVLAGDHLRSASDLGVPLLGIGLAYRDGFFTQRLDPSGWQVSEPAPNDLERTVVDPVLADDGTQVTVEVELGDGTVVAAAWKVAVGRVPLYLLDTDLEVNAAHHRAITSQLYGGDRDTRIRQELVLGVGGVRLLERLGLDPAVIHLNEGHAAFAGLERLRVHLDAGHELETAVEQVRRQLVFTTHTPVPAGHDAFERDLAAWHVGPLAQRCGTGFEPLWQLASGDGPEWSQTILALALSDRANGVARLHGEVSRRMWGHLWPHRPVDDVPIGHVTNGVHPAMWVGDDLADLFDWELGPDWRTATDADRWQRIRATDPALLWRAHTRARHRVVVGARQRLAAQARRSGQGPDGSGLDPEALTIGFARRFATYKRGTLLARDEERLARLVADDDRPVQVLLAGKAHPADDAGKHLIQHLVRLSRDPRFRGRIAFLEGYDLELARDLVAGVDVWLNTPRRPLEASGTSGMKAAANGVLNLSTLDGWWDEADADLADRAHVGFGWSIGDRTEDDDDARRDAADATSLYELLEREVVPTFYADRDEAGVPRRWVAMVQDAIAELAPAFSTHRMVADYVQQLYADPVHAG